MDSNAGSRFDGDQFAGWRSGDHWEWNSCRNDFPPPDCSYYNAAACTQQISAAPNEQLYAAFSFISNTDDVSGCGAFNGSQFTLTGNYMDLWELDPLDFDEFVGSLTYPNLTATRSCTFLECGPNAGAWQSATGGSTGLLSAEIQMTVSGVYDEEPIQNIGFFRLVALPRYAVASLRSWVPAGASNRRVLTRVPAGPQINPGAGTIVGSVSGLKGPIVGARVLILNKRGSAVELRTVRTDASGQFRLEDLSPDRHEILVVASGYGRARIVVTVPSNAVEEVAVTLPTGAEIAGRVVDRSGNAVGDAKVMIQYPAPSRDEAPDQILADWHRGMLITDENGAFRVKDVQPGVHFHVAVEHPTRGRTVVGPFSADPGQVLSGLLISLAN